MTPRINVLTFADYVNTAGGRRIGLISAQAAMYAPGGAAWMFYQPIRIAIKRGRQECRDEVMLAQAVERARPVQAPHYKQLTSGWLGTMPTRRPSYVPVGETTVDIGPVTVRVKPDLGLRRANGTTDVCVLYLKQAPLSRDVAQVVLDAMRRGMPSLLPDGAAVVVDVRRGTWFRPGKRVRKGFAGWMQSEAVAYAHHWELATSAA